MLWHQRATVVLSAVVVVLLQVFLAPHIAIGAAYPNFMVVFCMVVAIMNARYCSCVLPFVMGLAYDMVSGGPLGAMAFSLTFFSTGVAWVYQRAGNDTVFMALVDLVVGLLLVETCYGVILLILGYGANPLEAFASRILPCFLYDGVLSVIAYVVAARFFKDDTTTQPIIEHLN